MFSHEKLHVYSLSIEFVAWTYDIVKTFKGIDRSAKDQIIHASQSIPLNIAEGNGRKPTADRSRFFQIAYGSALECAAILDVLFVCKVIQFEQNEKGKDYLNRIVAMLVGLISKLSSVKVESNQEPG